MAEGWTISLNLDLDISSLQSRASSDSGLSLLDPHILLGSVQETESGSLHMAQRLSNRKAAESGLPLLAQEPSKETSS